MPFKHAKLFSWEAGGEELHLLSGACGQAVRNWDSNPWHLAACGVHQANHTLQA